MKFIGPDYFQFFTCLCVRYTDGIKRRRASQGGGCCLFDSVRLFLSFQADLLSKFLSFYHTYSLLSNYYFKASPGGPEMALKLRISPLIRQIVVGDKVLKLAFTFKDEDRGSNYQYFSAVIWCVRISFRVV